MAKRMVREWMGDMDFGDGRGCVCFWRAKERTGKGCGLTGIIKGTGYIFFRVWTCNGLGVLVGLGYCIWIG